jgi:predicted MFS family arabinose efflux permease
MEKNDGLFSSPSGKNTFVTLILIISGASLAGRSVFEYLSGMLSGGFTAESDDVLVSWMLLVTGIAAVLAAAVISKKSKSVTILYALLVFSAFMAALSAIGLFTRPEIRTGLLVACAAFTVAFIILYLIGRKVYGTVKNTWT